MMPGRLVLAVCIFILSVAALLLLSSVMVGVLPSLRIEGVITIMGILATILFKVLDLLKPVNPQPIVQKESQAAITPNPGTPAEPAPARPIPPADSPERPPVPSPVLEDWADLEHDRYATLVLEHDTQLVDIELNPPLLRSTKQSLIALRQATREINRQTIDPKTVKGIINELLAQMFPGHNTVQLDPAVRDLFVYYPYAPDDLGKIPFELMQKRSSELGVTRLPKGDPREEHAAALRRLLAAYRAPAKFRLLIVVHVNRKWKDVEPVLNEWLNRLPEGVEWEVYLDKRATPARVKNLIAGGGYDAIYFIAHHQNGRLHLHGRGPQRELDLRTLTVKDNPLIFLNACEAANIDSMAVRELLESGAGFVVATLKKIDVLEAIKFGGLFFDALFGCSTYHDYLNDTERFGLQRPERPLPVARALAWARRGFEQRNGTGWSYVLFGQPDPRKLEKLIQEAVEELRRHGLWKAVVKVRRCLRSEEEVRETVRSEVRDCLAAGDWDTIKAMGTLPPPYWGDLREEVQSRAEEKLAEREWQEVLDHKEVLGQLGLNAAERAEMAARADQLVREVKEDLRL